MKNEITLKRKPMMLVLALLVLICTGVSTPAQNKFTGTVEVINARGQSLGFNGTDMMKVAIDSAWNQLVPEQQTNIERDTDAQVRSAIGRSTRGTSCRLSTRGDLQIQQTGPTSFNVKYFVSRNAVDFYVTTPDGIPRGLDPHFNVTFDLLLDLSLNLVGTRVEATEAKVYVRNAKIDSQNVIADLVKDVNAIIRFFGGTGFFLPAERGMNATVKDQKKRINSQLERLNDFLAGYVSQGYSLLKLILNTGIAGLKPQSSGGQISNGGTAISIEISRPGYVKPNLSGNGSISGTISWDKAYGIPNSRIRARTPISSPCDLLAIQPKVSIDPGDYTPYPPKSFRDNGWTPVGRINVAPKFSQNGSKCECQYTVEGLPEKMPIRVFVDSPASVEWSGISPNTIIGFAPVGWSGSVTLTPRKANLEIKPDRAYKDERRRNQENEPQSQMIQEDKVKPGTATGRSSQYLQTVGQTMKQESRAASSGQSSERPVAQSIGRSKTKAEASLPQERSKPAVTSTGKAIASEPSTYPGVAVGRDFTLVLSIPPR